MTGVNKTVLVVEDEQMLLELICSQMHKQGINTVSARSVDQAIDYLNAMPDISAVWLDHYLMGQDDGLVLVSKIKSDNSNKRNLPIFVVSNTASDTKVRAYMNLGVDKYIVKSSVKLEVVINELILLLRGAGDVSPQLKSQAEPMPTAVPIKKEKEISLEYLVEDSTIHENIQKTIADSTKKEDSMESLSLKTHDNRNMPINDGTPTILIAEDEQILRGLLVKKFNETQKYHILEAQDGEVALDITMERKPDIVVLDMDMPKLNGLEYLEKLHTHYEGPLPYIVVLTNAGSVSKMAKVMEYGVLDYLIKADSPLSAVVETVEKRLQAGRP